MFFVCLFFEPAIFVYFGQVFINAAFFDIIRYIVNHSLKLYTHFFLFVNI